MIAKICGFIAVGLICLAVGINLYYYYQPHTEPKMLVYEYTKTSDEPVKQHNNIQTELQKTNKENSQTIIQKQFDDIPTPISKVTPIDIEELEMQIHNEVNRVRSEYGLKTLSYDTKLAQIARSHSEDMARNNFFDHFSSNGADLKVRYSGKVVCFRGGENLLKLEMITANDVDVIVRGWLDSPKHKANMLNNWSRTGIGVAISIDQTGYITQDFC